MWVSTVEKPDRPNRLRQSAECGKFRLRLERLVALTDRAGDADPETHKELTMNTKTTAGILISGVIVTASVAIGASTAVSNASDVGGESVSQSGLSAVAARLTRKPPIPVCPDCRGAGKTR